MNILFSLTLSLLSLDVHDYSPTELPCIYMYVSSIYQLIIFSLIVVTDLFASTWRQKMLQSERGCFKSAWMILLT